MEKKYNSHLFPVAPVHLSPPAVHLSVAAGTISRRRGGQVKWPPKCYGKLDAGVVTHRWVTRHHPAPRPQASSPHPPLRVVPQPIPAAPPQASPRGMTQTNHGARGQREVGIGDLDGKQYQCFVTVDSNIQSSVGLVNQGYVI